MATGIISELLDAHEKNWSDCFIRVSQYDCSIRVMDFYIIHNNNSWWPDSGYASQGDFGEIQR